MCMYQLTLESGRLRLFKKSENKRLRLQLVFCVLLTLSMASFSSSPQKIFESFACQIRIYSLMFLQIQNFMFRIDADIVSLEFWICVQDLKFGFIVQVWNLDLKIQGLVLTSTSFFQNSKSRVWVQGVRFGFGFRFRVQSLDLGYRDI